MKKTGKIVAILLLFMSVAFTGKAQQMKAGAGLILQSGHPPFGVIGKFTYDTDFILTNSRISTEVGFMFPQTVSGVKYNRFIINVDANYSFYSVADFEFYGIAGLNLTYYKRDAITATSSFLPGLTVGAGTFYNINSSLVAFTEVKQSFFGNGEFEFGIGMLIGF